jgi:ABC-2 type transport system ATP-binding protein
MASSRSVTPIPSAPPSASTVPAVRIRGLVKRFEDRKSGAVTAVDGLDLEIAAGECFGILGPNGAGKTTTIEIVEGLQDPTSGDVSVLGLSWKSDAKAIRERIGVQLQETVLEGLLTVRESLRLFASFYRRSRPIDDVLADVDLAEKAGARVKELSGGQKQRLAVGCALVADPEILFLDEPTTGLDPAARRAMWEVIRRFQTRGRTVVLTTHYMEEAERLCDRIAIVFKGRVAALGTPADLVARVGGEEVIEIATEPSLDADVYLAVPGVRSCRCESEVRSLVVTRLYEALPALLARVEAAGAKPVRLTTHPTTLEDAFLAVTGRRFEEAEAEACEAAKPSGSEKAGRDAPAGRKDAKR